MILLLAGCGLPPVEHDLRDEPVPDLGRDLGRPRPDAGVADLAGPAPDAGPGTPKGKVELTYYWVSSQADYSGANDTVLCDVSAKTLATVPLAYARALQIEGTGRLRDGRLLNVGGSCMCPSGMTQCYIVLDPARYPWGVGAGSRALAPYRSVAVDRSFIPLDTRMYVPELDGLAMPASYGFVHDGCVIAADTGGHITGAHIDFFTGERSSYLALLAVLKASQVTVYTASPHCR